MKKITPEARLERVLHALSSEVAAASDAEVLAAAEDLGMSPKMRGSAAFIGLKGSFFPYDPGKFLDSEDAAVLKAADAPGVAPRARFKE